MSAVRLGEARRQTRVSTRRLPTRVGARVGRTVATDVPHASGRDGWRVSPAASISRTQRPWLAAGGALTLHLARVAGRSDALDRAGSSTYPVTVRVIKERRERPWADEAPLLGGSARRIVWVREVELSIDGTPCVLAHSVTGLTDSRGRWRAMRTLRTRPLAILLYKDPTVRRSRLTSRVVGCAGGSRWMRSSDPLARLYARHAALLRAGADAGGAGGAGSDRRDAMRSVAHGNGNGNGNGNAVANAGFGTNIRTSLLARRSVFERHGNPLIITECFLPAFWQLLDRVGAQ